ncbi:hypothetical protein SAMN05421823_11713 [Catalinimonas alkaloidigena]|uniref:Uncharacterized protein n=1 Tax=Catalinimonas alkaloidigena TaxID=1075417 RepID=A0A1G9UND8_9BACT|nr:hypothetical protein [Catalinimonas alkaloidigena]SDM61045.1 hypothetical protein SAMN05421823_11713 [Catalinimonas alkaloidigena]
MTLLWITGGFLIGLIVFLALGIYIGFRAMKRKTESPAERRADDAWGQANVRDATPATDRNENLRNREAVAREERREAQTRERQQTNHDTQF